MAPCWTVLILPLVVQVANAACNGCGMLQVGQVFQGSFTNDISVSGNLCFILDGAQVSGSVLASGGAKVVTQGLTTISGSISAEGTGSSLDLISVTSLGGVSMSQAADVCIGVGADVGGLKVENSGEVTVEGTVTNVEVKESTGFVTLDGATVTNGGVTMSSTAGNLIIQGGSSSIAGSILVEKGGGSVTLIGVSLTAADLIIIEQTGDVLASSISLSDVLVDNTTGNIELNDVTTDSDTTISNNIGNVVIVDSMLGSDTKIIANGDVSITTTSFSLEDISVSLNNDVTIQGAFDFAGSILENIGFVTISQSTFTSLEVSKNAGGVAVNSNTGTLLTCVDNSPLPSGSGNSIVTTLEQCSAF